MRIDTPPRIDVHSIEDASRVASLMQQVKPDSYSAWPEAWGKMYLLKRQLSRRNFQTIGRIAAHYQDEAGAAMMQSMINDAMNAWRKT